MLAYLGRVRIEFGKQFFSLVGGLEVVGESDTFAIGLLLADRLEFFAALQNQLVFVLRSRNWGWSGVVIVRHGGLLLRAKTLDSKRATRSGAAAMMRKLKT